MTYAIVKLGQILRPLFQCERFVEFSLGRETVMLRTFDLMEFLYHGV